MFRNKTKQNKRSETDHKNKTKSSSVYPPSFTISPSPSAKPPGGGKATCVRGRMAGHSSRCVGGECSESGAEALFQGATTAHQVPQSRSYVPWSFAESQSTSQRDKRDAGKRSYRTDRSFLSRVLQPPIPAPKELRGLETHHRSQSSEQVDPSNTLQDGMSENGVGGPVQGLLGNVHRPQGRIFPRPYSSRFKTLPKVLYTRRSVPVQISTIRPKIGSCSLHQDSEGDSQNGQRERDTDIPVSRRLVHSPQEEEYSRKTHTMGTQTGHETGLRPKLVEIGLSPFSVSYLHRHGLGSGARDSTTHTGTPEENATTNSQCSAYQDIDGSIMATPDRALSVNGETGPQGEIALETSPGSPFFQMEPEQRITTQAHRNVRESSTGTPLVVDSITHKRGRALQSASTAVHHPYRCVGFRMGGSPPGSNSFRAVGTRGSSRKHQLSGDASGSTRSRSVPTSTERLVCDGHDRQHNSARSDSQRGQYKVTQTLVPDPSPIPLARQSQNRNTGTTHPREEEHSGRSPQQEGSDSAKRMEPLSQDHSGHLGNLGTADGGPVRHAPEPQAPNVCDSTRTPRSVESRCPKLRLAGHHRVCLPSTPTPRESNNESGERTLPDNPGSPEVAISPVVSQAPETHHGHTQGTATDPEHANAARDRAHVPESVTPPTSRLEALRTALLRKGFSAEVAQQITKGKRKSTNKLYDAYWYTWSSWCTRGKIDPFEASVANLAEFLLYLFRERRLAGSTIKSYRSAISSTIKIASGVDMGDDPYLHEVINSFFLERPTPVNIVPKWNLALVMRRLTRGPYEPMASAHISFVTRKTLFLLALASGKRRGELHGLTDRVAYGNNDCSVTLKMLIGFVSKTFSAAHPERVIPEFTIPALSQLVGEDEAERSLCPVRAIKWYLHRTRDRRASMKAPIPLFIPIYPGLQRRLSPATLGSWAKSVIVEAYEAANEEDARLINARLHDLRGFGASWTFIRSLKLETVLRAALWSGHTTFTSHYLKEFALVEGEMLRLGPIVTAQHIVTTGDLPRQSSATASTGLLQAKRAGGHSRKS